MDTSFENFDNNGFAIFENVLTPEELATFRKECESLIKQRKIVSQGDNDHIRNNILVRSDIIKNIFLQEKVINVIKHICGEGFCILPEISIMRSQYGGWHKDTTSVELFGYDFHKKPDFKVVNVAIYMQENSDFGGGLDVVPGSHKSDDSFVEYYRKQANISPVKKSSIDLVKSGMNNVKAIFKDFLRNNKLLPAKYLRRENVVKADYPLDSSDRRAGKYKIHSKAGDLVIFDLRLDHKASWPKMEFDPESVPTKYAFFAICGVNNEATVEYRNYLLKRSETQEAYEYLREYKISQSLSDFASKNDIRIL